MPAFLARAPAAPRDYAACSGCSLCLLVCPMWRGSHDPRLTPEALAKGLQSGATVRELAAPIEACSLCGACDPVCPERIDLSGLVMDLRLRLPRSAAEMAEIGDRPRFHESRNWGLSPISRGLSPISRRRRAISCAKAWPRCERRFFSSWGSSPAVRPVSGTRK